MLLNLKVQFLVGIFGQTLCKMKYFRQILKFINLIIIIFLLKCDFVQNGIS